MLDCAKIQSLLCRFRREREERVYKVSEGTADHTGSQRPLKATVEHLISECKKNNKKYTDYDFPLLVNESRYTLAQIKQWRRIDDVSPRAAYGRTKWSMFDDPQPSDVSQGELGNCWFMTAVSIVSNKPHLLQRIFVTKKYNKQGVYGLQLYVDGEWKYIIVDDRFPCNEDGELIFAWAAKMQLWVPLLEKALAKLFGSYSAIDGGFNCVSYKLLTGASVESFFSEQQFSTEEEQIRVFNRVREALKDHFLVSADSKRADNSLTSVGLELGHTYAVLDAAVVEEDNSVSRLLLLRNIWGHQPFTGKWGPYCEHWSTIVNKDNIPATFGDGRKGIFWIEIGDIAKYFELISICYARENFYEYHVRAALPRARCDEWEILEVNLTEETCIDMSFAQIEGIVTEYVDPIDATAFIFDGNGELIGFTDCYELQVVNWKSKMLAPGLYRICVFAFAKWEAASPLEYNFVVHSSRQVACQKFSLPAKQLRILLAKLVIMLGTQKQIREITFYTWPEALWLGEVIVASNNSETNEVGCEVKCLSSENAISTRTLGDTYDVLRPGQSQILQIFSMAGTEAGSYSLSHRLFVYHTIAGREAEPRHSPAITADNGNLHDTIYTDRIINWKFDCTVN